MRARLTEMPVEDTGALNTRYIVQLRCATLPSVLRALAVHCWFTVFDGETGEWHRWEVWQERNTSRTWWGHVHQDLMRPDRPVGGGPSSIVAAWHGDEARNLVQVLEGAPRDYPHRNVYRAWPGPNSNTFIAWVLRRAGIVHALDPRAVGKDYLGRFGLRRTTGGRGFQMACPLFGFKACPHEGWEFHVLCLTFGLAAKPFAVKTPFGHFGVPPARSRRQKPRAAGIDK